MTPRIAGWPSLSSSDIRNIVFAGVGLVVLVAFVVAARVVAHFVTQQLRNRNVRSEAIVLGRRVVYIIVIGLGVAAAFGLALQNGNVTLVGILLASLVAALGFQDLLKDYVSGYYLLFERHVRVGDRISIDDRTGTVIDVKLRVSLLRTEAGDLTVVPNSELFNRPVTIFAKTSPHAEAEVEKKSAEAEAEVRADEARGSRSEPPG